MKVWLKRTAIGFIVLFSIAGSGIWLVARMWRQEFEREVRALELTGASVHAIGLAPPSVPDEENAAAPIEAGGRFLNSLNQTEEPDWDTCLNDKDPDLADLERWVADRREFYGCMLEAMNRRRCRFAVDYSKECWIENPMIPNLLKCSRAHGYRAILSLRKGGKTAAFDLKAILRLSKSLSGEPLLGSQLIRYGIVRLAFDLLKSDRLRLSPEEWKDLSESFAEQSFAEDCVHALEMERAMGLEICTRYFFQGNLPLSNGKQVDSYWGLGLIAPKAGTNYVWTISRVIELSKQPYYMSGLPNENFRGQRRQMIDAGSTWCLIF